MPVWEISAQNPLSTAVKGPESSGVSEMGISSNSYVTSGNQMRPGLFLDTEIEWHRKVPSDTMKLSEPPREVATSRLLFGNCLAWVLIWILKLSYCCTNLSEVVLISWSLERNH